MGPLSWITDLHIQHPGRVVGQQIIKHTMPAVLGWVLGGNTEHTNKARAPHCKVGERACQGEGVRRVQVQGYQGGVLHSVHSVLLGSLAPMRATPTHSHMLHPTTAASLLCRLVTSRATSMILSSLR